MKKGWKEWAHFKWYKFAQRKVCLISANCLGPVLEQYLLLQRRFTDIYTIHPFMAHGGYMKEGTHTPLDDALLSGVDLLLYQHMSPDNIFSPTYADINILSKVPKSCKCVSIPNFWPLGGVIFPFQDLNLLQGDNRDVFYQDELLDLAYECVSEKNISIIMEFLSEYRIDSDKIHNKVQSFLERLSNRDKRTDVKTFDFIYKNYKKIVIFNDIGHPSALLMWEMGSRLMKLLNLETDESSKQNYIDNYHLGLGGVMHFAVARALGIEFSPGVIQEPLFDFVQAHSTGKLKTFNHKVSMEEFLQNYYLIRYGKLIE